MMLPPENHRILETKMVPISRLWPELSDSKDAAVKGVKVKTYYVSVTNGKQECFFLKGNHFDILNCISTLSLQITSGNM
jgi:hypothetical protein